MTCRASSMSALRGVASTPTPALLMTRLTSVSSAAAFATCSESVTSSRTGMTPSLVIESGFRAPP